MEVKDLTQKLFPMKLYPFDMIALSIFAVYFLLIIDGFPSQVIRNVSNYVV